MRLIRIEGEWSCPIGGASKHLRMHDAVEASRESLVPFQERRPIRPVHQPVR